MLLPVYLLTIRDKRKIRGNCRREEQNGWREGRAERRQQVLALHLSAGWKPGPQLVLAARSVEFHGVYSFQTTNPKTRRGRRRNSVAALRLVPGISKRAMKKETKRRTEREPGPEQPPHLLILVGWVTTIRSYAVQATNTPFPRVRWHGIDTKPLTTRPARLRAFPCSIPFFFPFIFHLITLGGQGVISWEGLTMVETLGQSKFKFTKDKTRILMKS